MTAQMLEVIGSIVTILAGTALLLWSEEREMGMLLIGLGTGTRAGSFTRGRVEAAK